MSLLCVCVLSLGVFQPPAPPAPKEMKEIEWLIGRWRGSGWIQMGPQRHNFNVDEHIQSKLDGHVLLVEGIGKDPASGAVAHNALAFFHFDRQMNEFRVKAIRRDGGFVDAKGQVKDGAFIWGFDDPRGVQVRFTLKKTGAGDWLETGEASMDKGKTWMQFLEMTLSRVQE